MKRFENLGAQLLTKEQQKKVTGGDVICACGDGTSFICVGDTFKCFLAGIKACANKGKSYCNTR